MKIGIIDVGVGNLGSLASAMRKLNLNFKICKNQNDLNSADKLILPGVGAFSDFMSKIKKKKIDKLINDKIDANVKILGVCLGFQIFFSSSQEHGKSEGLDILKGEIENIKKLGKNIRVPHVGWNSCKFIRQNILFDGIKNNSDFYFSHSFFLNKCSKIITTSETTYHKKFISSINYKNMYGVQFNPEKSQFNGLKLLKNFAEKC